MKEPLYIDCHTSKIKVTTINGQSEQRKILPQANENSEQKQANCHRCQKTKREYSGCEWLITFHEIG